MQRKVFYHEVTWMKARTNAELLGVYCKFDIRYLYCASTNHTSFRKSIAFSFEYSCSPNYNLNSKRNQS